jgi:hypothetical protein
VSAGLGRWWTEFVAAVGDLVPLPLAGLLLVGAAAVVAAGWHTWPGWRPRHQHWLAVHRWLFELLRWLFELLRWLFELLRWARQGFARLLGTLRSWPGRLRPGSRPRPSNRSSAPRRWHPGRWATRAAVLRWWAAARRRLLGLNGLLGRTRHRDRGAVARVGRSPRDLTGDESLGLADRLAAQGRYAEAVRERLRAMIRDTAARGLVTDRPGWTVTEFSAAATRAAPAARSTLVEAANLFSELWYGGRPALPRHDDRMRELADQLRSALEQPGSALEQALEQQGSALEQPGTPNDRSVGATAAVAAHPTVLDGTRW